MTGIAWLAVDWGTTTLRVWAMDAGDAVLAQRTSDDGMGRLGGDPSAFNRAFADVTKDWRGGRQIPAVVCGMAGAREGWQAAAYASTDQPLATLPSLAVSVAVADDDLHVRVLPGLAQMDPPDVMRGEETKLLGLGASDGLVVTPGTHTKWVRLAGGRITRFQTFMTGDVFQAIARHTVLRHTLGDGPMDLDAFDMAVAETKARPAALLNRAFGLRAGDLLHGLDPAMARARLSGWLAGLEVQEALATLGAASTVTLIGTAEQAARYARALAVFDVAITHMDADQLTLQGLAAARHALFPDLHP